jgi:Domain of unknown function (DUF305)
VAKRPGGRRGVLARAFGGHAGLIALRGAEYSSGRPLPQHQNKHGKIAQADRPGAGLASRLGLRQFSGRSLDTDRISGGDMTHRRSLIAALAVGALAGAAVAAFVLALGFPDRAGHQLESAHQHHGPLPLRQTAPDGDTPTFYSEMTDVNARMHDGMAVLPSDDVDRDFMRMMIPHHQGAIDMALVLLKYGHDERLKRLAQSIIVEQGQEIAYMHGLLDPPRLRSLDSDDIAGK